MSNVMKEYRRLARRRRQDLAMMERLSEEESVSLTVAMETIERHLYTAVKNASAELARRRDGRSADGARDIVSALLKLAPKDDPIQCWLFLDHALAIWKRLQEQEEATQEILEDPGLMAQIRAAREERGKYDLIPWDAIR